MTLIDSLYNLKGTYNFSYFHGLDPEVKEIFVWRWAIAIMVFMASFALTFWLARLFFGKDHKGLAWYLAFIVSIASVLAVLGLS